MKFNMRSKTRRREGEGGTRDERNIIKCPFSMNYSLFLLLPFRNFALKNLKIVFQKSKIGFVVSSGTREKFFCLGSKPSEPTNRPTISFAISSWNAGISNAVESK